MHTVKAHTEKLTEERFDALFAPLHQKVFRFCFRVLQDFADATTVCEWTWAQVLYDISRNMPPETESDLIRIASTQCMAFLNSRPSMPEQLTDLSRDEALIDSVNWEEAEVGNLSRTRNAFWLKKIMAALSSRQRVAIVLKYHYGAKYTDVARMLGTTVGTARTHLRGGMVVAAKLLAGRNAQS